MPLENKVVCRQGRVQENHFSLENCLFVHVILSETTPRNKHLIIFSCFMDY